MNIIISPYSSKLNNGLNNAKNYPYWEDLIKLLQKDGHNLAQVGVTGERKLIKNCVFDLDFKHLVPILNMSDTFISVDNFFPHFANNYDKSGIVLFSKSDPAIFGYEHNYNLYANSSYFRKDQFNTWIAVKLQPEAFVKPDIVIKTLEIIAHDLSIVV